MVTSELQKTDKYTDKCIHTIVRPDDPEKLLTLAFDWQREFTKGMQVDSDVLRGAVKTAAIEANKYFEDLAEGSRFDESIIQFQPTT